MEEFLNHLAAKLGAKLAAWFPKPAAVVTMARRDYAYLEQRAQMLYHWPVSVKALLENYLLYSTIASLFMQVFLFRKGVDIFAGYPIIVVNTAILLALNRLLIHRNHALFAMAVVLVSLFAARRSGTSAAAIVQQIAGALVFSTYYISMLTTYGLSVPRWMNLYTKVALFVATISIVEYLARTLHFIPQLNDNRLHWPYPEPSFFVYMTLPAIGTYLNSHLREGGGYRLELGIFLLSYIFAESSLGILGLFFVCFFAFLRQITFVRVVAFFTLATSALTGAFFLIPNFRLRVTDTFIGLVTGELQHVNASTFAVLANGYVAFSTFFKHPFVGIGLGGYQAIYQQYLPNLVNDDPTIGALNSADASSLFFRTAAEMGLFGLVALIGFLIVCFRVKGDVHVAIRNAIMPYFLIRMGRFGAYFSLELYFFVGIYLLNYLHYRDTLKSRPPALEARHAL